MPLPVAAIVTAAVVSGAARVVVASLGFGVVTYIGVGALIASALNSVKGSLSASGTVAQFAGMMGLDQAVTIVLAALAIRVSIMPLKRLMML